MNWTDELDLKSKLKQFHVGGTKVCKTLATT